jgi:ferredoxin-type protein NapH
MLQIFVEHLHELRRAVQITVVLFFIAVPILNVMGINIILGSLYSISIGHLDIVDPALVIQHILLVKELPAAMLIGAVIPLVLAILLGKVFCGWGCPYNLIAEYGGKLRHKFRPESINTQNRNPLPQNYWIVYGAILLILAIAGIPLITYISLPGLISVQMADLFFLGTVGIELLLVPAILLIEVFTAPRFWCRFACPVGATLGLVRSKRTLRVHFDTDKCTCVPEKFPCNNSCPVHLNPRKPGIYPYCYNCGECVDTCRHYGKALILTLQPQENMNETIPYKDRDSERS